MKKNLFSVGIILLSLCSNSFAAPWFKVEVSGSGLSIATIRGYGPVGIQLRTPGYRLTNPGIDCTMNSDGYCQFLGNPTGSIIRVTGSSGALNIILCPIESGHPTIDCQQYTVSFPG